MSDFDLRHALAVADHFEPGTVEWMTALLHDSVEDGLVTIADLRRSGLPWPVAKAVDALTRVPGENYNDYITRLSFNELAVRIKRADLSENLKRMDPEHESLRSRYEWALARLDATGVSA